MSARVALPAAPRPRVCRGRVRLSRSRTDLAWQQLEPRTDRDFLHAVLTCCALAEAVPPLACPDLSARRIRAITLAARQQYTPLQLLDWPTRVTVQWYPRWDAARHTTKAHYADLLDERLPGFDDLDRFVVRLGGAR
ncbi:hypothetical protein [Amycolatopsis sp. NPDC059021]|uniref:hypothetical protein n=1 Tax=Amycolatopsis sp. NPDC059021 TaxID=3346704 RepID=UPI003672A5E4